MGYIEDCDEIKMATKDWKKEYTGSHVPSFIYKTKEGSLQLVGRKFNDAENWEVFVVEPYNDLTKHIVEKEFKTKSQALSFAKSYMRKHPNG